MSIRTLPKQEGGTPSRGSGPPRGPVPEVVLTEDEMLRSVEGRIHGIVREFFVVGFEYSDLLQEGRLAALDAIRLALSGDRLREWTGLVSVVVRRRLIMLVQFSRRQRRRAMSDLVDLESWALEERYAVDSSGAAWKWVEDGMFVDRLMEDLTPLERAALECRMTREPKREVAARLGVSVKAIDNGQRRAIEKCRAVAGDWR